MLLVAKFPEHWGPGTGMWYVVSACTFSMLIAPANKAVSFVLLLLLLLKRSCLLRLYIVLLPFIFLLITSGTRVFLLH